MAAARCAARRLGGSLLQRTQAAVAEEGPRLVPSRFMRSRRFASEVSTNADAAASKHLHGIMMLVQASDALREFTGAAYISRAGAVHSVLKYAKEKDLQNPDSKREIICDAKLKTIFPGRDMVDMKEIVKLLAPHFVKSE